MAGPNKYGPGGCCGCGTSFDAVFDVAGICAAGGNPPDPNVGKAFFIRKVVGPDGSTLYELTAANAASASDRYAVRNAPRGTYQVTATGNSGLTVTYHPPAGTDPPSFSTATATAPVFSFGPDVTTSFDVEGPTPGSPGVAHCTSPGPTVNSMLVRVPASYSYSDQGTQRNWEYQLEGAAPAPGGYIAGNSSTCTVVVGATNPVDRPQGGTLTYYTATSYPGQPIKPVVQYVTRAFQFSACSLAADGGPVALVPGPPDPNNSYANNTQSPQAMQAVAPRAFAARGPAPALRVGLVAPCFLMGGAEAWTVALVDALAALLGPLVRFVGAAVVDPARTSAAALADLQALMPVATGVEGARDLAARCDVVVSWAVLDYAALYAGMAAPPRTLFACHLPSPWGPATAAMLAPVDRFVAVSPSAAAPIPAPLSLRAAVIPNAVDPARMAPAATRAAKRAAWGVADATRVVGYLGRLSAEKDPDACARLAGSLPPGHAVVAVGDGPLAPALAAGRPANLVLPGADPDRGGVLAAFDRLLVPSQYESFGLQLAEAWWAGLPTISTPVGVAGDNPSLARPVPGGADGPTLAAAVLADFADAAGTAKRAQAAQQFARTAFTLDRFGRAYAAALASLAPAAVAARIGAVLGLRSAPRPDPEATCRACDRLDPTFNHCGACRCPGCAWMMAACPLGKW